MSEKIWEGCQHCIYWSTGKFWGFWTTTSELFVLMFPVAWKNCILRARKNFLNERFFGEKGHVCFSFAKLSEIFWFFCGKVLRVLLTLHSMCNENLRVGLFSWKNFDFVFHFLTLSWNVSDLRQKCFNMVVRTVFKCLERCFGENECYQKICNFSSGWAKFFGIFDRYFQQSSQNSKLNNRRKSSEKCFRQHSLLVNFRFWARVFQRGLQNCIVLVHKFILRKSVSFCERL